MAIERNTPDSEKVFAARLRQAMDLRNISVARLAAETQIGESTIHRYLTGEREPIYGNLLAIASVLDVDLNFLAGRDTAGKGETMVELLDQVFTRLGIGALRDAPDLPRPSGVSTQVPVIGRISDGPALSFTDKGLPRGHPLYSVPGLGDEDGHAYGIVFEGDSMTPRILDGDLAVCSPDVEWASGDLAALRKKNGEIVVRQVLDRGSQYVLRSYNPSYDLEEIHKRDTSFVHKLLSIRPGYEPRGEAKSYGRQGN